MILQWKPIDNYIFIIEVYNRTVQPVQGNPRNYYVYVKKSLNMNIFKAVFMNVIIIQTPYDVQTI
jgi:hypothetical protein